MEHQLHRPGPAPILVTNGRRADRRRASWAVGLLQKLAPGADRSAVGHVHEQPGLDISERGNVVGHAQTFTRGRHAPGDRLVRGIPNSSRIRPETWRDSRAALILSISPWAVLSRVDNSFRRRPNSSPEGSYPGRCRYFETYDRMVVRLWVSRPSYTGCHGEGRVLLPERHSRRAPRLQVPSCGPHRPPCRTEEPPVHVWRRHVSPLWGSRLRGEPYSPFPVRQDEGHRMTIATAGDPTPRPPRSLVERSTIGAASLKGILACLASGPCLP